MLMIMSAKRGKYMESEGLMVCGSGCLYIRECMVEEEL